MSARHRQSTLGQRAHAWLELARISNLPTVWTNILVGVAAGLTAGQRIAWPAPIAAALTASLLYIAGMALNDSLDASRDAVRRPDRPIPSGRISRPSAAVFAGVCALIAASLALSLGARGIVLTLMLIGSITLYDVLHARHPGAAWFMGLNRAMVYLLGVASVGGPLIAWPTLWIPLAMGAYTAMVTLCARAETASRAHTLGWTVLASLALLVPAIAERLTALSALLGAGVVAWVASGSVLAARKDTPTARGVLRWLSGFCLIDAFLLASLGRPVLAAVSVALFATTALAHRRILGT